MLSPSPRNNTLSFVTFARCPDEHLMVRSAPPFFERALAVTTLVASIYHRPCFASPTSPPHGRPSMLIRSSGKQTGSSPTCSPTTPSTPASRRGQLPPRSPLHLLGPARAAAEGGTRGPLHRRPPAATPRAASAPGRRRFGRGDRRQTAEEGP
jgi:hypothetical protein